MRRRSIAFVLAAALLLALVPPASAAGNPTLAVGAVSGAAGDIVQVPITLSGNPGVYGVSFFVNYDSTKLSLQSYAAGALLTLPVPPQSIAANPIKFSMEGDSISENVTGDGVLLTLSFRIADGAAAGDSAASGAKPRRKAPGSSTNLSAFAASGRSACETASRTVPSGLTRAALLTTTPP
ncbi:MAG: hypothetical protein LBU05_04120 [Bifidobacteriaceae bacterium]|nr:hypothetical protein [Bifidobacteriaceae bacterium]